MAWDAGLAMERLATTRRAAKELEQRKRESRQELLKWALGQGGDLLKYFGDQQLARELPGITAKEQAEAKVWEEGKMWEGEGAPGMKRLEAEKQSQLDIMKAAHQYDVQSMEAKAGLDRQSMDDEHRFRLDELNNAFYNELLKVEKSANYEEAFQAAQQRHEVRLTELKADLDRETARQQGAVEVDVYGKTTGDTARRQMELQERLHSLEAQLKNAQMLGDWQLERDLAVQRENLERAMPFLTAAAGETDREFKKELARLGHGYTMTEIGEQGKQQRATQAERGASEGIIEDWWSLLNVVMQEHPDWIGPNGAILPKYLSKFKAALLATIPPGVSAQDRRWYEMKIEQLTAPDTIDSGGEGGIGRTPGTFGGGRAPARVAMDVPVYQAEPQKTTSQIQRVKDLASGAYSHPNVTPQENTAKLYDTLVNAQQWLRNNRPGGYLAPQEADVVNALEQLEQPGTLSSEGLEKIQQLIRRISDLMRSSEPMVTPVR